MPPNIVLVMSDEHAPMFSGAYGSDLVRTPNLDRLAAEGLLFEQAYTSSPLCVPARMSFMAGRYVSEIGTWDNTSPLGSDVPTWAHCLRRSGYRVLLSGKQHFVGPDKLHGFEAQLAYDLSDEAIIPLWPWTSEGSSLRGKPWDLPWRAGPGRSRHTQADDDVEEAALRFLREEGSGNEPFALCVSFLSPHFPFVVPAEHWEQYAQTEIPMPRVSEEELATQHPSHQRMRLQLGIPLYPEEVVRAARRAYFGLISFMDAKLGRILATLEECGLASETAVIYTSDHGDMLGEHGLWRKSSFYEESSRVPLVVRWPDAVPAGERCSRPVSLVDLAPTLCAIAGAEPVAFSGSNLLEANPEERSLLSEYYAHGVLGPTVMLRRDRHKFVYHHGEAPELFDLVADPGESRSIAGEGAAAGVLGRFQRELEERLDLQAIDAAVRASQRARRVILQGGGWGPLPEFSGSW